MILESWCTEISFEDVLFFILNREAQKKQISKKVWHVINYSTSLIFTHHEEGSSVVVLLQELVLALGCFVGDDFSIDAELSSTLLFSEIAESVDVSFFLLDPGEHT